MKKLLLMAVVITSAFFCCSSDTAQKEKEIKAESKGQRIQRKIVPTYKIYDEL